MISRIDLLDSTVVSSIPSPLHQLNVPIQRSAVAAVNVPVVLTVRLASMSSIHTVNSLSVTAIGGVRIDLGPVVSTDRIHRDYQSTQRVVIDVREKRGADGRIDAANPLVTDSYAHSRLLNSRIRDLHRSEQARVFAARLRLIPNVGETVSSFDVRLNMVIRL